jgi:type I restriction enzyme S subunit
MANIANLLTEHIDIWTAAESEKKSGRGNTSSNSNRVYGIKKLRELILELAISGKIVNSKEIWKHTKLGDIGSWAVGSGFPISAQGSQTGKILFAKVSDMNNAGNEKFILNTNNTITEEVAKDLKVNIHPKGTVIFPKIGGAIATNKRRILVKPTAIDNNCLGITPKNEVTTDWLYLILSAIDFSKYQAGTSVPALAQGVLQDIPVMLPSESVQESVVAKVDELMALCDQLEQQHSNAQEAHETLVSQLLATLTRSQNAAEFNANWQRIYAHFDALFTTEASIDALKQTLLQLAVMGKLVPQDHNDEPASELFKRIQAEKARLIAEGNLKKEKPIAPIADDEKPFELPMGWEWVRLSQITSIRGGSTPSMAKSEYWNGDILWISPKDMHDGVIVNSELKVTKAALNQTGLELVPIGSILIVGRSGILKRKLPTQITEVSCTINQDIKAVTPIYPLEKRYLYLIFLGNQQEILVRDVKQGTTVQSLVYESLFTRPFILPPLAEQHRIVAKVDVLVALCDQLKTRIQQANQQQQLIADALVAQAVA